MNTKKQPDKKTELDRATWQKYIDQLIETKSRFTDKVMYEYKQWLKPDMYRRNGYRIKNGSIDFSMFVQFNSALKNVPISAKDELYFNIRYVMKGEDWGSIAWTTRYAEKDSSYEEFYANAFEAVTYNLINTHMDAVCKRLLEDPNAELNDDEIMELKLNRVRIDRYNDIRNKPAEDDADWIIH